MEPSGALRMSSSMPSKSRPTVSGSKYRYFSTCRRQMWLRLPHIGLLPASFLPW